MQDHICLTPNLDLHYRAPLLQRDSNSNPSRPVKLLKQDEGCRDPHGPALIERKHMVTMTSNSKADI